MNAVSPVAQQYARKQLHQASKLAVADSLRAAAEAGDVTTSIFLKGKAKRLETCAVSEHVRIVTPRNGASVLFASNPRSCQIRGLCAGCEARRAKRTAADLLDLFGHVFALAPGARVLMLTLTSKNRPLPQLGAMLRHHRRGLARLFRKPRIVEATLGQFGNIEIDFANRNGAVEVHVHSHHLLVVEPGVFHDRRYIRQPEYVKLWREAMRLDYNPIVDIRAIRSRSGSRSDPAALRDVLREVCKYCLDTRGFLARTDGDLRVRPDVAAAFALATRRVRFTSMDRIFLRARKRRAKAEAAVHHPDQDPDDVPPGNSRPLMNQPDQPAT